jgi:UDP-2,3-diacylglucosamine hydrolase
MRESVFFVSDAHFKYDGFESDEQAKRDRFISFLAHIEGASRLYLLGDIFDFWFEYRSVVPRYYRDVLDALSSLRRSGTEIYIAGGNHDFWLGSFISETMGFVILPALATHTIQSVTVTMTHGDDLLPGELTQGKTERSAKTLLAMARDEFFRWGNRVFITGHVHYPCLERFGDKTFVILGDWERNFSYLEMREGRLSLEFYRPGEDTSIEKR